MPAAAPVASKVTASPVTKTSAAPDFSQLVVVARFQVPLVPAQVIAPGARIGLTTRFTDPDPAVME